MYNRKTLLLCFISTTLWGIGYPVLKLSYLLFNIDPNDVQTKFVFAGIRFLLSGILLISFTSIKDRRLPSLDKTTFLKVSLLGLCQTALQYGFFYTGMALTTGTKGSVLNQLCVFITVMITPIFFKSERLTKKKIIGSIIGFSGIVVMNLSGFSLDLNKGDIIVILSAFATAFGYIVSKAMGDRSNFLLFTGYQQAIGGTILLVVGSLSGGKIEHLSIDAILILIYLIFEAALAFSIWFYLLQHNDAGKITIFKFLTPIVGVFASTIILKENNLRLETLLALILVSLGIIIVNSRNREE